MWMTCCLRLGRNRKKYFSVAVGEERQRLTRQTDFQGIHSTAALPVLVPESSFAALPDGK